MSTIEIDRLEIIVEAEAKKASAELDKLINKLGKVSTAMRGATGLKLGGTSGINSTTSSLSKYTASTSKAISGTRSLTSQISRLAFAFYSVKRIVSGIGASIKKSMDFTETINLFQTSFKKIGMEEAESMGMEWGSSSADAFAKGYINRAQKFNDLLTASLGLDPNTMMNYQAVFAQMSNSMGLVTDSAMNISETFTMLGNDIASLWNIDTKSAMQKLQSGLAGQIRPLRQLGIDISQTSLQYTAMKYGIDDNVISMSQAAKVQLRWLSVMDQAEVAFGDMAKTIDSPANQVRILSQQWDLLSRSIGNVFLPVVQTILPIINAVVIALRNMINTFATAMGYELPDYTDSNIYTDATTDIEGMEDATNGATKANEKLKKSLMSIDEINILSKSGSSGSGDKTGSGYGVLDDAIQQKTDSYMKKFNEELEKMSNKSKLMAENIQAFFGEIADKISPTVQAFGNLWNAIKPFAEKVGQGLSWFIEGMLSIGESALTVWIPAGLNAIADVINSIPPDVAVALGGAIGGIATAFLAYKALDVVVSTINLIGKSFKNLLYIMTSNPLLTIAFAVSALAGAVLALDKAKFESSSVGKYVDKIKELVETSKDLNEEIDAMLKKQDERTSGIESEYGAIQILADKYFALADKETLTNAQQILMKSYADELIKAVPELSSLIDEQTGAYSGTKSEIEALITKTKEYYLVQAAQESLIEIAKAQFDTEKSLKTLEDERATTVAFLKTKQDELSTALSESAGSATECFNAHQKYDGEVSALENSLALLDTQITDTKSTQGDLTDEWDYASEYITTYATDAKTAMDKVKSAVTLAYGDITKAVKDWKLPDLIAAVKVDSSALTEFMKSQTGSNILDYSQSKFKTKGYATGGYPTPGQLFVANEPGNPELIGNVGGRTAVMNNNQIVEAVSQGVAIAVAGVIGGGNRSQSNGGDVVIMVDSEEFARIVNKGNAQLNGRFKPVMQGG